MGHGIFVFMASVALFICLMAGVFLTADSLSAEKREGTLGLLFLTDLKGYDVVLGKLAANSLQAVFGILAAFPILALPLLTGGLSGGEFWRTILVLVVALYFSLSIGMLVSAASQDGRQAMGRTLGAIIGLAGVMPVLWMLQSLASYSGRLDFLLWPSPVYAYTKAFDSTYGSRFGQRDYWISVTVILSLASGCIAAASFLLPRMWQRSSAAEASLKPARFRWFGKRRRRRPLLTDQNPFHWLALGDRGGQSAMNRMLILLGVLWVVTLVLSAIRKGAFNGEFACFLAFGLHFAAKVLIASESGRRFHQDRQSGALDLLLVTPLPVEQIVAGQRAALRKQFGRALWAISVVNLVTLAFALVMDSRPPNRLDSEEVIDLGTVFGGGVVVLWLDASALSWVGMWRGLKATKFSHSVLATLSQVVGLPWLAIVLFIFFAFIVRSGMSDDAALFFLVLWFGLGAAVDLASISRSRENLLTSLRSVVSERQGG
jgi:ABC-type transport system involved in multi-copper enzyme maturation permease subunit